MEQHSVRKLLGFFVLEKRYSEPVFSCDAELEQFLCKNKCWPTRSCSYVWHHVVKAKFGMTGCTRIMGSLKKVANSRCWDAVIKCLDFSYFQVNDPNCYYRRTHHQGHFTTPSLNNRARSSFYVVVENTNRYINVASDQALLFGRVKRVSRERASERRSREGQGKGELVTISHKISSVLRPDEGKCHWLKNDVPEIKVDW